MLSAIAIRVTGFHIQSFYSLNPVISDSLLLFHISIGDDGSWLVLVVRTLHHTTLTLDADIVRDGGVKKCPIVRGQCLWQRFQQ